MIQQFISEYYERGWTVIPDVFPEQRICKVLEEYEAVKHVFSYHQSLKGLREVSKNATHHTHLMVPSMWTLLDNDIVEEVVETIFGGKAILNTMGLSEVSSSGVYTQNIHRDVRTNTGPYPLWLNTLIMLDDSTKDNGATWMMENSFDLETAPTTRDFFANAVQACGNRGDLLVFNCNLWHCAGKNTTTSVRRIITPFFSRPFIKQQLDLPRAYGENFAHCLPGRVAQWMGYNSRVPVTLGEFYQKPENRFYKSDQG